MQLRKVSVIDILRNTFDMQLKDINLRAITKLFRGILKRGLFRGRRRNNIVCIISNP